jgi:tetratricopeptide (TPR) repeat protein
MVVEDSRSRRRLAGDLDAVVLKALRKEAGARYPTVARLDEDVDRHLKGQPLSAREHTWPYRTAKFAGRHTFGLAAAALLLLTLAGGFAATMWQARQADVQRARAERHFDEVRALASSLIFEIHDGIENLPGAIPTRQLLIERALGYFDSLAADEESNPALQRELASAYDKLADVLGRPYASNLGNSREALNSYRKALAIREKLAATSPDHQTQLDLWSSYYRVGNLLRETADTTGALAIHRRARDIITGLLRSAPDDPTLVNNAARTAVTMAHTFEQAGMIMESLESAREGLSLDERRLARNESNNAIRADVATGHGRVGIAHLRLGDPEAALEHLRQRVSLARRLVDADPGNVAFRRGFSTAQLQLGQALARAGDTSAAIREQQVSLDVRRALADQDPTDRQAQIDVMFANLEIGQTLTRSGDLTGAVEKLRAAVRYCETLTEADPDYVFYRLSLASASTRLSHVLNAQGLAREAAPLAQRAMELMESASGADPADVRLRFEMALAYEAIGDAVASGAQQPLPATLTSSPARAWYQKSSDVMEQLRQDGTLPGGTLLGEETAKLAAIRQKMIARAAPSEGVF